MYSVPMQAQNKENWQSIILPSEGLKRNCKNESQSYHAVANDADHNYNLNYLWNELAECQS
jgi:hypothetical protein